MKIQIQISKMLSILHSKMDIGQYPTQKSVKIHQKIKY